MRDAIQLENGQLRPKGFETSPLETEYIRLEVRRC